MASDIRPAIQAREGPMKNNNNKEQFRINPTHLWSQFNPLDIMWQNQAIFSSVDVFCTLILSHLCFFHFKFSLFSPNCRFRKRFLLIASTDYKPTQSHRIWEMIIFDYLWVCGSINSWKFEALLCFPPEPLHISLSLSPSTCYHCSLHKLHFWGD